MSFLFAITGVFATVLDCAAELSPIVPFVIPSGRPDAAEVRGIVGSLAEAGCDQFLVYPSTGLDYDYLGEEFFAMVGTFLGEAKARNMKVWLYDEFNWPSGTARGRVPAENEKCLYRELVAVTNAAGKVAWEIVVSREANVDNYCLDTNNLEPESVRRFMELTHLEYERRFGKEMGPLIRGIFSDEPGHCSGAWRLKMPKGTALRLPWWSGMEEEYRLASGGRDFRADLEAAIRGGALGGCEALRLWTDLRSRRYRRTYFDRIAAWCRKVGIVSAGHLVAENDTPMCARVNGSPLHTLKGFTKPGIDLIASNTDRDFEWITLAFGQSAALSNGTCGMAELFALGPCDLTFAIMRKLYWICALHGIDTYFQATYHHKACRFDVKDGWAMFTSPTQPWFREMPLLHATAKEAARWAAKPFVCEIAVVYPQRELGAAGVSGAVSRPPIEELCRELSWNQFTYRLIEEDETTDCPVVLDWEGPALVVRGTKTRFADAAAAVRWLEARFAARPRVTDAAGRTRPGFITRAYRDGSAVAVDAASGEVIIARDGKFVRAETPTGAPLVEDGAKVSLSLSGRSCRRVWFRGGDNRAEIRLTAPLKAVRFAVCRYPADRRLSVTLDGRPLDFAKPCASVAFAFDDLYRETEPVDLGAGEHVFALSGGNDGKLFLPAMWMVGDFVECERNVLSPFAGEVRLGSLASAGLGSFAGTATYRLEAKFATGERLSVDSGGAVARVRFGGRDLGAKGWAPFVWEIPEDLVGRKLPLEIDVVTSIRPIFGSETNPDAKLNHGLWVKPSLADPSAAGLRLLFVVKKGKDRK